MKKASLLFLALAALTAAKADAQMIDGSTDAVVQRPKPIVKTEPAEAATVQKGIREEDVKAVLDAAETPPVAMTPEQKAEIDLAAKKICELQ